MEQITKRIKNSLIQGSIANIILLIFFGVVIWVFFSPRLEGISEQKTELMNAHQKLAKIKKEGISFWEFKSIASKEEGQDEYLQILLQELDVEFYKNHFTNLWDTNYEDFLSTLSERIDDIKSSTDYTESQKIQQILLPFYDQNSIFSEQGLSNFDFVNYVERLLYTFNLEYTGDIGIGDIEKIWSQKESNIQEEIYKIPLVFDINGQKRDFIELLHFLERVASIEVSESKINVYKDDFIKKRIDGNFSQKDYNIYENQLVDIHTLSLAQYPDSSSNSGEDILTRIRWSQWREKISAGLELYFYVSGLPWYKIEEFVYGFLADLEVFKQELNTSVSKHSSASPSSGWVIQALNNLKSLETLLISLDKEFIKIEEDITQRKNIDEVYERVVWYRNSLDVLRQSYEQNLIILQNSN